MKINLRYFISDSLQEIPNDEINTNEILKELECQIIVS